MSKKYGYLATIGADVSGVTAALKQLEDETKHTNSQLKAVKEGLKFQPTSMELLESQASALSDQIEITTKKLEALKSVEDDAKKARESYNMSKDSYAYFLKQISDTEAKLKTLNIELTSTKGRISDIQNGTPKESALTTLDKQLSEIQKSLQLNPGNLELVGQKYNVLGQQITLTKEKLDELKKAQDELSGKLANGEISSAQYDSIRREVLNTEASLRKLVSAQNDMIDDKGNLKDVADGYEEIGDKADDAGGKVISLGDLIKSNMISDFLGNVINQAGNYIKNFVSQGIELASDLTEVQNVVDTTFGGGANQIYDWADAAATSFGMSSLQAQKFNGTMGAMLKSMGLTDDAVLKMSTDMVGLSGDMASFYNLNVEDAFYKIRAGISGEIEPLKALGINMSVANLEAFALSQGIEKTWKQMNQAEQATLRYNYLMAQTADAQGDFERTSDSFANQQRILKLQIDNLSASLGEQLLPHLNNIFSTVNDKLPQAEGTIEDIGEILGTVTGFAVEHYDAIMGVVSGYLAFQGALKVGTAISTFTSAMKTLTTATQGADAAQKALNATTAANPYVLIVSAIAAVAAGLITWANNADTVHNRIKDLNEDIENIKKNTDEKIASDEAEIEVVRRKADRYEELLSAQNRTAGQEEELKSLAEELQQYMPEGTSLIDEQTGAYQSLAGTIDSVIEAMRRRARFSAYEDEYKKLIEEQIKAEKNLEDAKKKNEEVEEKRRNGWYWRAGLGKGYVEMLAAGSSQQDIYDADETLNEINAQIADLENNIIPGLYEESETAVVEAVDSYETYADYMQAMGEAKSKEESDRIQQQVTDYETALQAQIDAHKNSLDLHQIDEEEYQNWLGNYLEKNKNVGSKLYWSMYDDHQEYLDKKKTADEKAAEEEKKLADDALKEEESRIKERLETVTRQHDLGDLSDIEAANRLEEILIDEHCERLSDTWSSYYKKANDYRDNANKEELKDIEEQSKKIKEEAEDQEKILEKSYEDLAKDKENALKELSDIDLSETVKDKDGNETEVLTDLDAESKKLDKYMSSLEKLKQTGISDSLLEQVYAKSYADGSRQKFIDTLLGLSENNRKLYYQDWEKLQDKQQEAADMSISNQLSDVNQETADSVTDIFGEMSALAYEDGEETARNYLQGIIDSMGGLNDINTISSIFSTAFSAGNVSASGSTSANNNSKILGEFSDIKLTIKVDNKETVTKTLGELIGMGTVSGGAVFNI